MITKNYQFRAGDFEVQEGKDLLSSDIVTMNQGLADVFVLLLHGAGPVRRAVETGADCRH